MKHAKAVVAVALALLVSGCTQPEEEKRAFEVPDSLCGTPIPAELLSPVLPASGEKITEEQKVGNGYFRCTVSVNGNSALSARWEWWDKGTRVTRVAGSQWGVRLDEHVSDDGTYTYADKGGVSRVTCPEPSVPRRKTENDLFAQIYISDYGRPDEAAMEKLIQAYAKALSASPECVQK
ncbi:hypothetical protein [Streptomyces sp. NRRL F-5727]|uniref:hypothetical protein n=1 Tax=Streptomyces sp. NRRL F-5727 TaxID=1463871 RepID=UPI0004C8FDF0|nr:hypothetical protein [Streptomyces sp. NRRL F-5727]